MRTLFAAHKNVDGLGPPYTPFDEVLATADVMTLHCPLTPATRNMVAAPEFAKMKKRPLLINCARGGLVNEAALVDALDRGQIAGVGFDCLTSEPPAKDNPPLKILARPNVIVTPHVAWASGEAMQTLWNQVILHIENFHAGRPSNRVYLIYSYMVGSGRSALRQQIEPALTTFCRNVATGHRGLGLAASSEVAEGIDQQ